MEAIFVKPVQPQAHIEYDVSIGKKKADILLWYVPAGVDARGRGEVGGWPAG